MANFIAPRLNIFEEDQPSLAPLQLPLPQPWAPSSLVHSALPTPPAVLHLHHQTTFSPTRLPDSIAHQSGFHAASFLASVVPPLPPFSTLARAAQVSSSSEHQRIPPSSAATPRPSHTPLSAYSVDPFPSQPSYSRPVVSPPPTTSLPDQASGGGGNSGTNPGTSGLRLPHQHELDHGHTCYLETFVNDDFALYPPGPPPRSSLAALYRHHQQTQPCSDDSPRQEHRLHPHHYYPYNAHHFATASTSGRLDDDNGFSYGRPGNEPWTKPDAGFAGGVLARPPSSSPFSSASSSPGGDSSGLTMPTVTRKRAGAAMAAGSSNSAVPTPTSSSTPTRKRRRAATPKTPALSRRRAAASKRDSSAASDVDMRFFDLDPAERDSAGQLGDDEAVGEGSNDANSEALVVDLVDVDEETLLNPPPKEDKSIKLGTFQCIICMDNVLNLTVTYCGHLFCNECLHAALHIDVARKICPICRQKIELPLDNPRGRTQAKTYFPLQLKLMTRNRLGKRPARP